MTAGAEVRHLPGMAKGRSGWRQTHSGLRRHSSEGWNPGKGCRIGDGMAGFIRMPTFGYRARVLPFPLCGNGLFKPLDSGLRRNDNGGFRRAATGLLAVSPRPHAAGANFTSAQAGFPCPAAVCGYWIGAARSGAPPSRHGLPQRPALAVSARNRTG